MATRWGHDLEKNVWRSGDVNLATYAKNSNQIEVKAPSLSASGSESKKDSNKSFLLKNSENTTFSLLKINEQIVDDLKRCGFIWASPIQTTCIPLARLGIDLIAQAKSGTGKTIVFVVCALEMVIRTLDEPAAPKALILVPTREIAVQICTIIDSLTVKWRNFSCFKAIGGTKVSETIAALTRSQIVVGTPGRICCLLEMDFLKPDTIRLFVLDECDKLMEENFKKQVNAIFNYLPANKQMIVTSATMSATITAYLSQYMRDPTLIRLNAEKPSLIGVMQYVLQIKGHCLDYLNFESKIDPLIYILKNVHFTQCFIFLNYQTRVKYLYDRLRAETMSVTYITGNMIQQERLQAIESFRKKKFKIFVSTDLTSRGIDIETVNLVVNVDVPFNCETYLHRVGRAGRFGSSGIAITIVAKGDEHEKFCQLVSAYKLHVQDLELPITTNLWDAFYHRDQHPDTDEPNGLKLNSKFKKIMALYDDQIEMGDDYDEWPSSNNLFASDDPHLAQALRRFHLAMNETTVDDDNNDGHPDHNGTDVINVASQERPSSLSINNNDNEEAATATEESCGKHYFADSPIMIGQQEQYVQLFRQAFVNPSWFSACRRQDQFLPPTIGLNHITIFKYLLKGGEGSHENGEPTS